MSNVSNKKSGLSTTAYYQYALVSSKKKSRVCSHIRLACQRFLADLKRNDLEFRQDVVDRCIGFVGLFHHYQGQHNRKPFILEAWQQFIVANIFGFYWKTTGRRRYTTSYVQIARKNGKTFLAAAIAEMALIADHESGAEVLIAANSREQAHIAFDMCATLSRQLNARKPNLLTVMKNEIKYEKTNSRLKCVANEPERLDGFSPSFGLIDEFHADKTGGKCRDVIRSGQGARTSSHLMTITTAGFDKESACYALRCNCVEILRGLKKDDSTFAAIYELDEGDVWHDEKVWHKANPNMGVTVVPEFLREQVTQALNNPADEVGVKTKNFNVWCDVAESWIDEDVITSRMQKIDWSFFDGKAVYAGVDLAAVSDLTALAVMSYNTDGKLVFKVEYYLPESALLRGNNASLYREWKRQGYLRTTSGNVTDYSYITDRLEHINNDSDGIIGIAYDPWNSVQWAIDATEKGLNLMKFNQNMGNFNKPTKEFQRLILGGEIIIDYNPITQFCFRNVVMKEDLNSNVRPVKQFKDKKIDGVIAIIEALGVTLLTPHMMTEIA